MNVVRHGCADSVAQIPRRHPAGHAWGKRSEEWRWRAREERRGENPWGLRGVGSFLASSSRICDYDDGVWRRLLHAIGLFSTLFLAACLFSWIASYQDYHSAVFYTRDKWEYLVSSYRGKLTLGSMPSHDRSFDAPLDREVWWIEVRYSWLSCALVLAPGAWFYLLSRARARAKRVSKGLCPACGYDMRATPEKCPECGTEPVKAKQLTS